MSKRILLYFFILILTGGLYYFVTENLIFSIISVIIGAITLFLICERIINKFFIKDKKIQECTSFINNFIITLSINKSILTTYEVCKESFSKTLIEQDKLINNLQVEEKIHYLNKYFNCSIYEVFLKLLDQYIYNGGDILKLSQILLFDVHQLSEEVLNHKSLIVKKLIEFISLWILTFIILIIMKFSLANYFEEIMVLDYFRYGMLGFFTFFYVNLILFIFNSFNLSFVKDITYENKTIKRKRKEKKKDEKIKRANAKAK